MTGEESLKQYVQEESAESPKRRIIDYIEDRGDTIPLILIGDVLDCLKVIPQATINTAITSPPYWQQRDYEVENQIGVEKTPEEYVNKLADVSDTLYDVLKDDGSFFLNIGDKYDNKKNLQLIPSRVAIEMQNRGWVLRNFISWYKPNHMPESVTDRFSRTWEPVFFFFFVKESGSYLPPDYYFDIDSVRISHKDETEEELLLPFIVSEEEYPKYEKKLEEMKRKYSGKFKGHEKNKGASPGGKDVIKWV